MRLAVFAVVMAGCTAGGGPAPLPRIVSAEPQGKGVAPDSVVGRITFSEPVDPAGVVDGRRFALAKSADVAAVARAAGSPEGIGPDLPAVEALVALVDEGRIAELRPVAALQPESSYALILGEGVHSVSGRPVLDPTGQRRTFVAPFETGKPVDRQPPVPRWAVPPNGPAPRNIRRIEVAFDEPVQGSLALESSSLATPVDLAPDRLGLDLQGELSGELAVSLQAVQDLAGNRSAPLDPISLSDCSDTMRPVISASDPIVEAGELSFQIRTTIEEMARLGVEIRAASAEQGCGAIEDPETAIERWGEYLPCLGHDPCTPGATICEGLVAVSGLCPGRHYLLRLMAEDLAGNRAEPGAWIEASTADPRPMPVLTEVLVDAATPEAAGEYVEVANIGTGEADLSGYKLTKLPASGTPTLCDIESVAGGAVQPGGYAIIVGGAYDNRYALGSSTPVYRCGTKALLGGLANDRPPALSLVDPRGETVSSIGIQEVAPRCPAELSAERIHPAGPDASSNFACSLATPGTPGACNGATPEGECPKRPW